MAGRKPKPNVIKLITGNPGRRPLNKREPKPRPGIPSCPSHLSLTAKAEWRRIVPLLSECGLVTEIDRAALASLLPGIRALGGS
jgi:phage terminase small subunit